ncbi:MAG: hypothetical protein RR404_01185 [Bacilli bacterium]
MRTKLTIYNTLVSLLSQVLFLVLSLIFPRLIILTFGSEVNGLTSSINQILNIINLLQVGIVGASIYDMYKPIIEGNEKVIGSIYYTAKTYFNKVSLIFFVFGIIVMPFFLLGGSYQISFIEIFLSVIILTLNGALVFKYISSYDIIISAHQRKYILVYSSLIEKIIYYGLLFLTIYLKTHFIFMYISILIGTLFRILYLRNFFNKTFLPKIFEFKSENNYKVKNQKFLLINQIVQQLIESIPTLIISKIYGFSIVSVFSLYNMIVSAFKMLATTIQNSVAASFGDLAETDKKRASKIFDIIQLMFVNLGTIVGSCMIVLCLPFISLYSAGFKNINYSNVNLSIFMSLFILSFLIFLPYNMAINSTGKYKSVTRYNLTVGVICIIIAVFAAIINFDYCIIPFILFYLVSSINYIRVIKSECFDININKHLLRIIIPIIFVIIYYFTMNIWSVNTWIDFIIIGSLHFGISSILVILTNVLFDWHSFKNVFLFIRRRL